jgi:hypothetical protein
MRTVRWVLLLVAGLGTLLGVGPVSRAYATPPTIQDITINHTFLAPRLTAACGFPVQRHDEGTLRVITRFDQNGNPIRELDQYHFTLYVSANGHTLTALDRETHRLTFHADGSMTFQDAGPGAGPGPLLTLPGHGVVFAAVGGLVIEISPSGEETTVRESGLNIFNTPVVCAALSP